MVGFLAIFFVGLILGLLGGGGSILSVPILTYLFAIPATTATVYSLMLVGLSSLVGTLTFFQKKLVDLKRGTFFIIPSTLGVATSRRLILPNLPEVMHINSAFSLTKDRLVLLVFAMVMLGAAFSMLRPRHTKTSYPDERSGGLVLLSIYAFGAGTLMGFVGAGGGFLIIPVLVGLLNLEMKHAVGTSLFIIAVSSLLGFGGDLIGGVRVDIAFSLKLTGISAFGVWIGTRLSVRISGEKLKWAFGLLVAAVALLILIKEIFL